jgi:hypothetical protein
MRAILWFVALTGATACAQTVCGPTPTYGRCEIVFDLPAEAVKAHPNPYESVDLWAEFRSPGFSTFKTYGYWDGGSKFVFRFSPNEVGNWTFRVTSNVPAMDGKSGSFSAVASEDAGFIHAANLHHWRYSEKFKPHLWMGDTCYRCGSMERGFFDQIVAKRAEQKFTHIRMAVMGWDADEKLAFPDTSKPNPAYFQELDNRVAAMNSKGIIADLILGTDNNLLAEMFPTADQLKRYLKYVTARYAAYNVTWQMVQEIEEYRNPRDFVKQMGLAVKEFDPYSHPRTTHTLETSAGYLGDGWMDHILYQSSRDDVGAIEHQAYSAPQVNSEFGYEDSGAGKTHAHHVDSDTFRKRLWNATMNGQYPTFGNTGVYGSRRLPQDAKYLGSPGAKAMTAWFDFFSRTRWFELEPYFDVEGARALATPDVEYVVYVEKPGPFEIKVVKRSYQVYWVNPITGETVKQKKDWKGEETEAEKERRRNVSSFDEDDAPTMVRWKGEPPDNTHDWVLHLSRDGRKEGLYRSYKFESRRNILQEPELAPMKMPFELAAPAKDAVLPAGQDVAYEIKLKRETLGTRRMYYIIKGEIARDGEGQRLLAAGVKGTLRIPAGLLKQDTGTIMVRVFALNAFGKLYAVDAFLQTVKPAAAK